MSVSKRRCATCRYFQDAGMAGNGWCTHPKRQLSSDVRILVRRGELACRDSWGVDYWEDQAEAKATPGDTPRPAAPESTATPIRASFDDEVTSVVSRDATPARVTDPSDRVMEQTTLLPEDPSPTMRRASLRSGRPEDLNEPAHRDQQDRVDTMARGSRDAILRARERHRMRRRGVDDTLPGSYDDILSDDEPAPRASFSPDDYVEDEAPSARSATPEAPSVPEDVILEEGAVHATARSRRLRRAREQAPAVTTDAVPASEMSPDAGNLTVRRSDESRFDSIPEIKSNVELPRLRRHVPEAQRVTPTPSETPDADAHQMANPYDEVLKRAKAIKAAAKAEREDRLVQERRAAAHTLPEPPFESVAEPEAVDDAAELAPREDQAATYEMSASDWADEPAFEAEAQAPPPSAQVDTAWLASRGIRFQRQRPTAVDAYDTYPDDEPFAVASDEYYDDATEDILPEPAARRSWWRGIFQGRAPQRDDAPSYAEAYDSPQDDPYAAYDDPYDVVAEEDAYEDDWTWAADDSVEHDVAGYADTAEQPPVISTSLAAYAEDEHTFVERPHLVAPWQVPQEPENVNEPAVADPSFEPINLDDEQGLNAFRSRLFASTATATATTTRTPITMRRQVREEPAQDDALPSIDPATLLADPRDAGYEYEAEVDSRFDVRTLIAQQGELLDMTIDVSPDIPRKCATCRSYRMSEQGERGWCTNSYAFTHRQMVNAEDLACQSTIGCWWLPADEEVWLDAGADAFERPTPRIDRLVAALNPVRRVAER